MDSKDVFTSSKQLEDISAVYMEAVYGKSAGQELADREKKDDAFGAPNKKKMVVTNADKKANTPAYQNYKKGDKRYAAADHLKDEVEVEGIAKVVGYLDELKKSTLGSYIAKGSKDLADRRFDQGDSEKRKYEPDEADDKEDKKLDKREQGIARAAKKLTKEEVISEKQKDTPDQVAAVIDMYRSKKGTDEADKLSDEGKKKAAKKERDYAKFERDKMARDAQKSGHPWEHAKGSTTEKEGKKSVKHAHVKDSYEPLYSTAIQGYANAYQAVYENWSGNEQNELVTKEVKALQKAAKTGKGKDVAKADKIADEFDLQALVDSGKFSEEELKSIAWNEGYQRDPEGGEEKERQRRRSQKGGEKTEKVRGERTPMPPRGDKRREDFERWYAANVR